jgi:hypothetical protein
MSTESEIAAAEQNLAEAQQAVEDAFALKDNDPPPEPIFEKKKKEEDNTFGSDADGIASAAAELQRQRYETGRKDTAFIANEAPIIEREVLDPQTGRRFEDHRTLSAEEAATLLTAKRGEEQAQNDQIAYQDLIRSVDDFRQDAHQADVAAYQQLNDPTQRPVEQQPTPEPPLVEGADAPDLTPQPEFDNTMTPLQQKLAALDPEIRGEIEQQTRITVAVHDHYVNQAKQMIQNVEALAYHQIPEFNNLDDDQRRAVLHHVAQSDPNRAAQIVNTLQQGRLHIAAAAGGAGTAETGRATPVQSLGSAAG